VRQHVNPLSRFHQLPRPLPAPAECFAQPALPLHLDIGSARGRFLLELAALEPEANHLGVEIRRPLVEAAEAERQELGLTNLRFLFCNANVSLEGWLGQLPRGLLRRVSIQFPDPWFKKKHHKRRVLQPALLLAIAAALAPGKQLFVQSDVLAVIEPMLAVIDASGCFEPSGEPQRPDAAGWLLQNPLPVPTERETYVLEQGLPVYRRLYRRNGTPPPALQSLEQRLQATDNPADTPPSLA
jgi:tRNA (guanine-N7-)-methyltransferase